MPKPKPKVTAQDAVAARAYFADFEGLEHLRVRPRADLLIVESGPDDEPIPHARLRRVTAQTWQIEMATHTERWENTHERGPLRLLLQALVDLYGWTLAPRE